MYFGFSLNSCDGVAGWACGLVGLGRSRVADICVSVGLSVVCRKIGSVLLLVCYEIFGGRGYVHWEEEGKFGNIG